MEYELPSMAPKNGKELNLEALNNSFNSKNSLLMKMKDFNEEKESFKFAQESKNTDFFLTQNLSQPHKIHKATANS